MNKIIMKSDYRSLLLFTVTLLFVFVSLSFGAFAAPDKAKGPKCQYRDLDSNKIISYDCDRFQSKGDIDSITPQMKIISPEAGDTIDYDDLDENGNGQKVLPIKIVISPIEHYVLDRSIASSAGTEYAFLPQVDGVGHAHGYCAPEIEPTIVDGEVTNVQWVGMDNISRAVCGFCVFSDCEEQGPEDNFQVCNVDCPLNADAISNSTNYRVIVDTTENSHGPRIKHHPQAVPPGDQVIVNFSDAPNP